MQISSYLLIPPIFGLAIMAIVLNAIIEIPFLMKIGKTKYQETIPLWLTLNIVSLLYYIPLYIILLVFYGIDLTPLLYFIAPGFSGNTQILVILYGPIYPIIHTISPLILNLILLLPFTLDVFLLWIINEVVRRKGKDTWFTNNTKTLVIGGILTNILYWVLMIFFFTFTGEILMTLYWGHYISLIDVELSHLMIAASLYVILRIIVLFIEPETTKQETINQIS
ncbi:MAG: hypothetical protein ACTSUV_02405 [Candidatus Ranarchaeia archaeon]